MDTPRNKADWRRQLLAARSARKTNGAELKLAQQVSNLISATGAETVASYHPMRGEPCLLEINAELQKEGRLVLPKIQGDSLRWLRANGLTAGPFGTKSPTGTELELRNIDLMLIPALAVDRAGFRLGRGGGFYDRALADLAQIPPNRSDSPLRVAVVFDDELVGNLPSEPHDIKMHAAVTENGVTWFV